MKYFKWRIWSSFYEVKMPPSLQKIKNNFIIQAQKISEETKRQSYIKCKSAKAKNITKWVFEKQKLNSCLYKIFLKVINPFASRDIGKNPREKSSWSWKNKVVILEGPTVCWN